MKLIKLLSIIIVSLVITNVTLTNRAVDQATTVSQLTAEIQGLENNNHAMRSQIATQGSLTRLSSSVEEAGFTVLPQIVSLPTPSTMALR